MTGNDLWQSLINGIAAILKYLYEMTVSMGIPSYGVAIIILTLLIKVVLYPLTHKQMHSMKKMQEIQPKVAEIQAKYKKSPEKANQLIMEMYKENKVNPMSGCFPLLLQMPVLFALFRALQEFQYQELGSSFLWIPHLKNPDPYFIIPVLVAATTFLQTKLTTPGGGGDGAGAQTQKTMLYMMPLFIGYISLKFPAGLGLYWIFFSVFGTIQQLYINRQPAMQKGEMGSK